MGYAIILASLVDCAFPAFVDFKFRFQPGDPSKVSPVNQHESNLTFVDGLNPLLSISTLSPFSLDHNVSIPLLSPTNLISFAWSHHGQLLVLISPGTCAKNQSFVMAQFVIFAAEHSTALLNMPLSSDQLYCLFVESIDDLSALPLNPSQWLPHHPRSRHIFIQIGLRLVVVSSFRQQPISPPATASVLAPFETELLLQHRPIGDSQSTLGAILSWFDAS